MYIFFTALMGKHTSIAFCRLLHLFKALTWKTSTLETVQCLFDSTIFCIKKTLYLCCTIQRTVKQILVKSKTVKTAAAKDSQSAVRKNEKGGSRLTRVAEKP